MRRCSSIDRPDTAVTVACDHIASDPATETVKPGFLAQLDVVGYNYVDRWRERAQLEAICPQTTDAFLISSDDWGRESGGMGWDAAANICGLMEASPAAAVPAYRCQLPVLPRRVLRRWAFG